MRNRASYTDRFLARLWRTRAVQGAVLAGAGLLLQVLRRRGGSTLNYGFESPPVLDALERFLRERGKPGGAPRVVDMPVKAAGAPAPTSPDDPPPST